LGQAYIIAQKDKDPAKQLAAEKAYSAATLKLNKDIVEAKITGARQISGAVESMLKEGSDEQRVAHAITMGLAGIELAMNLQKVLGIGAVTAAETASVAPKLAANQAKAHRMQYRQ